MMRQFHDMPQVVVRASGYFALANELTHSPWFR
jgi:hypothetical protein